MYVLKKAMNWGWSAILITVLAILGYFLEWPIVFLAIGLVFIMLVGFALNATAAREKELENASLKLKELSGYFTRRFAGNSSLSIFTIIDSLFSMDDPKLWDWARACDMSQRIFNTWCDSFISRVESDIKTRRFTVYLRTYLNELWFINSHYYEFSEQFYEIAAKKEIPRETAEQYNRFVVEYNSFIQHFREHISELRRVARTEIEPPSVKMARELAGIPTTSQSTIPQNPRGAEHDEGDEHSQ